MSPASFLELVNMNMIHRLVFQHIFAASNAKHLTKRNGQCQGPNNPWRRADNGYKNKVFFHLRDEEKTKNGGRERNKGKAKE